MPHFLDERRLRAYFDGRLGPGGRARLFRALRSKEALRVCYRRELLAERALVARVCGTEALGPDGSTPLEVGREWQQLWAALTPRAQLRRRIPPLMALAGTAAMVAALLIAGPSELGRFRGEPASMVGLGSLTFEAGCPRPAQAALDRRCAPGDRLQIRLELPLGRRGHAAALVVVGERVVPVSSRPVTGAASPVLLPPEGVALATLPVGMLTVHVMVSEQPIPERWHAAVLRGDPLPEGLRTTWTRLVLAAPDPP